jgi:hypothetical protein
MPTHSCARRKRGPAIAWAPTQNSQNELARRLGSAIGATPLYLTQSAILELEAHLRESSSPLPFGLLAGDVCLCPHTQVEYLLIDTVTRARIELTDDDPYAQLSEELRSLISEQAKHQRLAIGWYLGGLADDLTLDSEATDVHRELFPERWQIALLHGELSGAERGALVRFERTGNYWYSIPFFEEWNGAGRTKGERHTALRWANYRADEPTLPLDELEGRGRTANVASPSWLGSRDFSAFLQPRRWAGRRTPDRSLEPSLDRSPEPSLERTSPPDASARYAEPRVPKPAAASVAVAPHAAATSPLARPEPLEMAPAPQRASESVQVEATERSMKAAAGVSNDSDAPLQLVFIDGRLVPTHVAKGVAKKRRRNGSAIGVRNRSLFVGVLALVLLFVLYVIAR